MGVVAGDVSSGAVDVLARAARAVHGPGSVKDKIRWVVEAAGAVTGASYCAFFTGPVESGQLEWMAGVPTADVVLLGQLDGAVHVPVTGVGGRVHGTLVLGPPEGGWAHPVDRPSPVALALAAHLGVALDNLGTLQELAALEATRREMVHQLQEAVRPPMPEVETGELGVYYLPADPSAATGGDLYDWMVLPDGDLHVAVVDVVGKGVGATKEALSVTHALRLLVLDGCPIDLLISRVDALTTAHNPDLVATVLVGRYRPSDGTVYLAGGGHPPALLMTASGRVDLVTAPGVPIGWPGAGSSAVATVTLGRHDTLVLYTDGLIEANKDVEAGLDGLIRAAAQVACYPAPQLARSLVERALWGAVRRDDSLALVLRRRVAPVLSRRRRLSPFEYRFSPNRVTVPLARHLLADWLDLLPVEAPEAADLVLAASELCANAVRNATGAPGGLTLRAWAEGGSVVMEVEDDGAGFEFADRYDEDDPPDPEAEHGRGLYLVEAVTDDLSVRRVEGHNVVRVVKRAVLAG